MNQNNSLSIKNLRLGSGLLIKLEGNITEALQFNTQNEDAIVFDLDGVHRITSLGVKAWINALQTISKGEYFFVRCRPSIVSQFNMIANFGVRGGLATMYAPYNCPSCGKNDIEHHIDLRHAHPTLLGGQIPEVPCPGCGAQTDFDDLIDVYFEYARANTPPTHPLLELYLNSR